MNIDAPQNKPATPEEEVSSLKILQQLENLHSTLFSKLSAGLASLKEGLPATIDQRDIAKNILRMLPSLKSLRTITTVLLVFSANPAFAQTTLEYLSNLTAADNPKASTTGDSETLSTIQQVIQDSKLPSHTIPIDKKLLQQALESQDNTPQIHPLTDIPGVSHELSGDATVVPSNDDTTSAGSIKTN